MTKILEVSPEIWYNLNVEESCFSRFLLPKLALKNLICYYKLSALAGVKRLTLSSTQSVTRDC
jgi:hypothetical protein